MIESLKKNTERLTMKYCKDCKYLIDGRFGLLCRAPENEIDLVNGRNKVVFAHINRSNNCGEEAKFFKQKEAPTKRGFWSFLTK